MIKHAWPLSCLRHTFSFKTEALKFVSQVLRASLTFSIFIKLSGRTNFLKFADASLLSSETGIVDFAIPETQGSKIAEEPLSI